MRARISFLAALAVAASSALVIASSGSESEAASATKQRDFVVAGSDGYGTQDCLATGGQCGRIVADALCESKGFKASLAYRKLDQDEITGSTSANRAKPVDSFLISCRE